MSEVDGIGPHALPGLRERSSASSKRDGRGASASEVSVSMEQGCPRRCARVKWKRSSSIGTRVSALPSMSAEQGLGQHHRQRRRGHPETVAAALAIARHASQDEFAGLADATLMARELPDLDLYHPWSITPEQAIEQALSCESAAFDFDARIRNADGTSLNTHQGCRAYGNSNGFIGGYCSTRHSQSCVMIAESEGQMQRDYFYDVNRIGEALIDPQTIGRRAAERAVRRLGARPIPTCEVPVLFAPELATGLFSHFIAAISGGNLYRKASYLEDALEPNAVPRMAEPRRTPTYPACAWQRQLRWRWPGDLRQAFVENGRLISCAFDLFRAQAGHAEHCQRGWRAQPVRQPR